MFVNSCRMRFMVLDAPISFKWGDAWLHNEDICPAPVARSSEAYGEKCPPARLAQPETGPAAGIGVNVEAAASEIGTDPSAFGTPVKIESIHELSVGLLRAQMPAFPVNAPLCPIASSVTGSVR